MQKTKIAKDKKLPACDFVSKSSYNHIKCNEKAIIPQKNPAKKT